MTAGENVHASAVLIKESGVLVRGAPGSGKSSLVLALVAGGADAALVADDRVLLTACNGRLVAAVPDEIAGLMEVRGLGLARRPHVSPVVIDLVVDLVLAAGAPRLPPHETDERATVAGLGLPRLTLPMGLADAALRVRAALGRRATENADLSAA